jgi:hypothetical protein
MRATELLIESAVMELVKELPSLAKHDYNTIDTLMRKIAKKNHITGKALHDLFLKKYKKTPDNWIKDVKEEGVESSELDIKAEVEKFAEWAMRRVHLQKPIKIDLSYDTEDAQTNHHTGRHTEGDPTIWVYAKNRNLVDILRTVFHEIVHCRQSEIDMIKPGDSYPGSPIEAMADMLAGKYIKIYGEKHHYIFQ